MNRAARTYLGVGGMIASSTAGMPSLTYVTSYELAHVLLSETRPDTSLLMLAAMALVMIAGRVPVTGPADGVRR